jgi:transcriptional regulator with XRE-family HTH domain
VKIVGGIKMFYDRLKMICDEKGVKMTPLLKELGISPGNTEKWKNGTLPNGKILIKLAEKLNCSTDYLLGLKDTP